MPPAADDITRAPGPARKVARWWLILAAVLALGTGGAIAWANRDDRPQVREGQLLTADTWGVEGRSAMVTIPWHFVEIKLSEPLGDLPDYNGHRPVDFRPPPGGSWIAMSVELPEDRGIAMPRLRDVKLPRPEFTLIADGRRYSFGELNGSGPEFSRTAKYLAVAGEPSTFQIEVGYDTEHALFGVGGAESRPDRFTTLGTASPRLGRKPCLLQSASAGFDRAQLAKWCKLGPVLRVPYVGGLGWAPRGKEWLVVVASVDPSRRLDRTSAGGPVSYRVSTVFVPGHRFGDGLQIKAVRPRPHLVSGVSGPLLIAAAPVGARPTLTVELAYASVSNPDPAAPGLPEKQRLKATWRAEVP